MATSPAPALAPDATTTKLQTFLQEILAGFPWRLAFRDASGATFTIGRGEPHWAGDTLEIDFHTHAPARDLLAMHPLGFLERFLAGEADMRGNLYLLAEIRDHLNMSLPWFRTARRLVENRALRFQSPRVAQVNVKSHYDISQDALDLYLDRRYQSYSCGIFEDPTQLASGELIQAGQGRDDHHDSLEKAQWRKFDDAAQWVSPAPGETVLDVGCGYGGQLEVLLDHAPRAKVAGWTHSANQVRGAEKLLAHHDPAQWEVHEGDYRAESRVFHHITSTGMISHVGPRGLEPYVREVRKRIKTGGRYLHHSLMTPHFDVPFDANVGVAFNKKYVWPGFHWFTLADHIRALEQNGFEIARLTNLSPHYAKTTAAWYERLAVQAGQARAAMGEATFRAWQVYLASASTGFKNKGIHVYRLYCHAI